MHTQTKKRYVLGVHRKSKPQRITKGNRWMEDDVDDANDNYDDDVDDANENYDDEA